METTAQYLIYAHVASGILALFSGLGAILFKKGSGNHKRSGRVFFYSMLASAGIAIVVTFLPEHDSPFLLAIGLFSAYFALSGRRALQWKHQDLNISYDKVLAWSLFGVSVLMLSYPMIFLAKLNIVLSVFGAMGVFFSMSDLRIIKNPGRRRREWQQAHAGKILGAYISCTTAFVVVNSLFPFALLNWFLPGVVGGVFIIYWIRKLNKARTTG